MSTSAAPLPLWPDSQGYRRLVQGRPRASGVNADGLSREEVAADQRRRLQGAMIEIVSAEGYTAATTRSLSKVAGVSKEHMYKLYRGKEVYFLDTFDTIVTDACEQVGVAYRAESEWKAKLRAAFDAYARVVVAHPKAARFALVGALGAGPPALELMRSGRQRFEEMIAQSFAGAPDPIVVPPLIIRGIVSGIERVTRQHLYGEIERLPGCADELLAWALSYRCPASCALACPADPPVCESPARTPSRVWTDVTDEQKRILRAAAELTALGGYRHLTNERIVDHAGVRTETFVALYGPIDGSAEAAMLDALSLLAIDALECVRDAARGTGHPLTDIHRGMVALMRHIAGDPILQQVAFVEVFAAGSAAIAHREDLLHRFNALLVRRLPKQRRPPNVVLEAIVGAVWGLVHQHVTSGTAQLLPALAGHATYLALAPVVGGKLAARVALSGT